MLQLRNMTILLVEDDDGDARTVQRAFKKSDLPYAIVRASDGIEALDILRGTNGKEKLKHPFLIFVDINMPRMNGIEFITELRKDNDLHTSIIFVLTTSNREEDRISSYDLNIAGYMVKKDVGNKSMALPNLATYYDNFVVMPT